ncbi:hypothetical protein BH11MYX1_BH11MYX1_45220 [soil metagenome]
MAMMSHRSLAASLIFLAACGGGDKKVKTPKPKEDSIQLPPEETEASRELKRKTARLAIVPEGANCLPAALKEPGAPRLELAGVGADAVLCAVDVDGTRLLGPVGCWKVDLESKTDGKVPLVYRAPAPAPGHSISTKLHDGCGWGFCSPGKNASGVVEMSWNADGSKVAMLAGTDVHIFDVASKKHLSTFGIAGDKGVSGQASAIHFVGDSIVIEGGSDDNAWVWKADGTATGVINALGGKDEKPIAMKKGSFSVLDATKIGLADHGMDTFTVYELESGKRSKAVRKPAKLACKPAELEAYWADGDKVTDKCKEGIAKTSGPWIGATGVLGAKNLLFVMQGERLGELAIVDPRTLAETKKALKMPWCGAEAGEGARAPSPSAGAPATTRKAAEKSNSNEAAPSKASSRAPVKKGGDPEDGGE